MSGIEWQFPNLLNPLARALEVDGTDGFTDGEDGFRVLLTLSNVVVQIRRDGEDSMVTIPVIALLEALEQQSKEQGQ